MPLASVRSRLETRTISSHVAASRPARANGKKPPPRLMSVADFAKGFVAPEFLVEGIVQRGYCYSLAAPTGTGKTAVALGLGFSVATGRPFGRARTERGRVAFFAGENPDDVRGRVLRRPTLWACPSPKSTCT